MHVDAVFTDLDGTFWSPDMTIHANSLAVVNALDKHQIPFVIATGRRALGAHHGLTQYGLGSRPAILMNGALVREALDGETISVVEIDESQRVVDIFRASDLEPVVYIDHPENDMLIGNTSAAGDAYLRGTVGFARVDDIDTAIADAAVIGFGAFGYPLSLLEPIETAINDSGLATAVIGVSHLEGDYGLMVQAHEIDKQVGIAAWCKATGIDVGRVAVVGDGHNDIEMLEAAKIAIVPDNAPPEILELADAVIPPNEAGGWDEIPRILGLG